MGEIGADVLLVGRGLGATAAAKLLAESGHDVVLIPGIGRTRFPHLDGGVVNADLVSDAFGHGAPLGRVIRQVEMLTFAPNHRLEIRGSEIIEPRAVFKRSTLETWAMERAVQSGARFIDDLVEGKALPNVDGTVTMTSERDKRTICAGCIVLCEGADPRIPTRVNLRPDYGPEDQIHFARTLIQGPTSTSYRRGSWRTSWGMPVELALMPQEEGVIVSVAARIENVMRCSRSSKDALEDFLGSSAYDSLGIAGIRGETGVELVYLRQGRRNIPFVHDRLAMGLDMAGVIDVRSRDRADVTIRCGLTLGRYLRASTLSLDSWPDVAQTFVNNDLPPRTTYHEDGETGFLEEDPAGSTGSIATRFAKLIRRGRST